MRYPAEACMHASEGGPHAALPATSHATWPSYRHHSMPLPRPLDALARGHLQRATDRLAGLARVDHVVDQVVARCDVHVEHLPEPLDQLGALGLGVLGFLDLFAKGDLHD